MNRIIKQKKLLFLLLYLCNPLLGDIIITEFFIEPAEGTTIPEYIELFNNSNTQVNIEGWSIETKIIGSLEEYNSADNTPFTNISTDVIIEPYGYFLISSNNPASYKLFNNQADVELNFRFLNIGDYNNYLGTIKGCEIIIINEEGDGIDTVRFNVNEGWGFIDTSGYSIRLHTPNKNNNDPTNWSLSPETENSLWLYEQGTEIQNFGSPREENSFRLIDDIKYADEWFPSTSYTNGDTHTVYGDVNDYYRAEPFVDENGNGQCDNCGLGEQGELYHDRNGSNFWDSQNNNYNEPLEFSWAGPFIDTTVVDTPDIQYKIIIEKSNTRVYNSSLFDSLGTEISIVPLNLLIDSLGLGREIAEYTWTVELTKIFSNDSTDTIYSDKYTFTIDASDYGRYGCVDNGSCTDDGDCPTNAYYEDLYNSNHPTGCTPGIDCYSALNYYKDANINSNRCQYVSISIPSYVTGNPGDSVALPIYLSNDSLAVIDMVNYTLSPVGTTILSFYEGFIFIPEFHRPYVLSDTAYQENDNIYVEISYDDDNLDSLFKKQGVFSYLPFNLDSISASTSISLSNAMITWRSPDNPIYDPDPIEVQILNSEGEIVILQENYQINGFIKYYDNFGDNELFEVPDVGVKLIQQPDGSSPVVTTDYTTLTNGYFGFESLSEGHYTLSFSKDAENDSVCPSPEDYVTVVDLSKIARYVGGDPAVSFDSDQAVAADVTLDGTISGLDASKVAQYIVGLIGSTNPLNTYWIFKPKDESTLEPIYADLINNNGQYEIEYSPLVFDDISRYIYAYRLGDVNGNYCYIPIPRERDSEKNTQFENINISFQSDLPISIIMSEPTYIEGLLIEIGYNDSVYNPLSFNFDPSSLFPEHYESMSNLYSKNGTVKIIIWASGQPQLISGLLGEITFNWENENAGGEIWLEKFTVNDQYSDGIITLSGYEDDGNSDGLNIINEFYPEKLSLKQNYPNPFNPKTSIYWTMPNSGSVQLEIYNLRGQLVDVLFSGYKTLGTHEIIWNALGYSSGIYFYRLTINGAVLQKKMILLR